MPAAECEQAQQRCAGEVGTDDLGGALPPPPGPPEEEATSSSPRRWRASDDDDDDDAGPGRLPLPPGSAQGVQQGGEEESSEERGGGRLWTWLRQAHSEVWSRLQHGRHQAALHYAETTHRSREGLEQLRLEATERWERAKEDFDRAHIAAAAHWELTTEQASTWMAAALGRGRSQMSRLRSKTSKWAKYVVDVANTGDKPLVRCRAKLRRMFKRIKKSWQPRALSFLRRMDMNWR